MSNSNNPVKRLDFTVHFPSPEEGMDHEAFYLSYVNRISSFLNGYASEWVYQLEAGASNGTPHFQGRMVCKTRMRSSTLRKAMASSTGFDMNHITTSATSSAGREFDYVMKTETRMRGPLSNRMGLLEQVIDPLEGLKLRDWQSFILNNWFRLDLLDCNDYNNYREATNTAQRKILFVVDSIGGTGKSTLVKHMAISHSSKVCILPVTGNVSQLVTSTIDAGAFPCYVIDLPRIQPSHKEWVHDLLFFIECLQNGLLISSMYGKRKQLIINNPRIVIFSNYTLPELMSQDRYVYLRNVGYDEFVVPDSLRQQFTQPAVLNVPSTLNNKEGYDVGLDYIGPDDLDDDIDDYVVSNNY